MNKQTITYRLHALISAVLIITLSAGLAWGIHMGARQLPLRQYFTPTYTNAVWDWTSPTTRTEAQLRQLGQFLYLHQINTTYVDLGTYADTLQITEPARRAYKEKQLQEAVEQYVRVLGQYNVRVFAAAGHTDWSKPANREIPEAMLRFAHTYNQTHPHAKLAGMQFDIEAYNQAGFAEASYTEKGLVLVEFLEMVDHLASLHSAYLDQATNDAQMELGFAVPYWFDNENDNIKSVTWRGKTGPTIYHLLDRLNELPRTNIVVMAYRNAALGNDGAIAHSRTEVEYAQAKTPRVKVIIGQEVSEVEPAKITFYGKTPTELSSEVKLIYDELGRSGSLGGIAINDLSSYRALQENE